MITARRLLYLLCLLVATLPGLGHAAGPAPAEKAAHEEGKEEKPKAPRFPGFNKQRKAFKQLCAEIAADGHLPMIYGVLMAEPPDPESYPACSLLYRTFAAACKPKPERKRAKPAKAAAEDATPTPAPTPLPKLQELSAKTALAAVSLTVQMADNDLLAEPSLEAVNMLAEDLRKKEGKSDAELSYAAALADRLLMPFDIYRGYHRRRKPFRKLCEEIYADEVGEAVFRSIAVPAKPDPGCPACRPLMLVFSRACDPAHNHGAGLAGLASVAPEDLANPAALVKEQATALFGGIAEDEKLVDESVPAVLALHQNLKTPPPPARPAEPYLSQLAEYVSAPFKLYDIFNRYKEHFARVCLGLEQDQRREALYKLMTASLPATKGCPGCRALVMSLAAACSPQAVPAAAPAVKLAKEREPHIEVVQTLSEIFPAIAANPGWRVACIPAIKFLDGRLRDPAGKTKAELDYFATMARYIYAPFAAEIDRRLHKPQRDGQAEGTSGEDRSLDGLFDF